MTARSITGGGEGAGDDAAAPEGAGRTGRTGRPTVRRAVVATGEWNADGARPEGEGPTGRPAPAAAPLEPPVAEEAVGVPDAAGEGTTHPSASGDETVAGSADDPSGQDWEQEGRPSPRKGAKILLAVVGVGAVLLVTVPLLSGGGSSEDHKTQAVGADRATSAASPQIPVSSDLPGTPGSSASTTAKPSKSGTVAPSHRAVAGKPDHGSSTSPTSRPAAPGSTRTAPSPNTSHTATAPTSLVITPLAKLVHGAPWKTDRLQLGMQSDGNLVLYDNVGKRVMWAAGTSGQNNTASFQTDGNLVVYNPAHNPLWASDASGYSNATLTLQSDGNVVIRSAGKSVWATNTHF